MESRKITIVSTKDQQKTVFMSTATTLAELKQNLKQNNIDYEGMTFYEGTSKTELIDDSSVLPHDILYKGQVTNELVFMLTNTKKIKSGILSKERAELYNRIKKMNLQEKCISLLGKNYTQCSSAALKQIINDSCGIHGEDECDIQTQNFYKDIKSTMKIMNNLLYSLDNLVTKHLSPAEKSDTASTYSDEEINEMFNFLKKR